MLLGLQIHAYGYIKVLDRLKMMLTEKTGGVVTVHGNQYKSCGGGAISV